MSFTKTSYGFRKGPGSQKIAFHDRDNRDSKFVLSKCIKGGNGKKDYIALPDAKHCYGIVMDHIYGSRCFSGIIMENTPGRVHFDADLSH